MYSPVSGLQRKLRCATCMHTCIQIYIHTHVYIHTYIHTHKHTYTYIHTHTHIDTHIHIHIYIHIHTFTYIHTYTQTYIHTYTHTHTRARAKLWPCTVNDKLLIFFWTYMISDRLSGCRPLRVKENSPRWTKITTIIIIIIIITIVSSPSFPLPLGCCSPWLFSSINPTQAVGQFGWRHSHFEKLLSREQTVKQPRCNGISARYPRMHATLYSARCRPKRDVACTTCGHLTYCCW